MIYIDELIFLNFVIDYILLSILKSIMKLNTKRIRIIFACLIGEASIIYLFVNMNNFTLSMFKIILCSIMIFVAYGYINFKEYIKNIIYFYILSFFLGGCLLYFKSLNLIKYNYFILLIPVIMKVYKFFAYNLKNIINYRYRVNIYLNNGKVIYLNGFMDSGNSLIDPFSNKKVIIINKDVDEDFYLVPYKTIDSESLIKCFKPRKVYIDGLGERNDVVVGVINKKFNGFNCLLNYKLMEGI